MIGKLAIQARQAGEALLDAAFPARCVGCGRPAVETRLPHVCQPCFERVYLIGDPRCRVCGYPFFGETDPRAGCPHCERLAPAFGEGRALALFRGAVRELLRALKYESGLFALRDIRELFRLAPGAAEFLRDATLVPVPLHPRRLRERGYNQSELIAQTVAPEAPGCRARRLLARVQDTKSQTGFNREDRLRNLRNAFSLVEDAAIEKDRRHVVIDDVFTTGSTLNASAQALRAAGVRRIDVLAVGHG